MDKENTSGNEARELNSHVISPIDIGRAQAGIPNAAAATNDIYSHLANHQLTEAWFGQNLIGTLQEWANRFCNEFKLDIPEVVLGIDRLASSEMRHFKPGHNELGLKGVITLNTQYLDDRPFWDVLGTLLHELLHAWQDTHGQPSRRNHHNVEFINKARECGLVIGKKGVQGYAAESIFKEILRKYGITVPAVEMVATPRSPGKSNSKSGRAAVGQIFGVLSATFRLSA